MGHGVPEQGDGHRLAWGVVVGQVGHGDRVALHLPRGQAHGCHGLEVQDGSVGHELEVIAAAESNVRAERGFAPLEAFAARRRPPQRGAMVQARGSPGLVVHLLGAVGPVEMVVDQQVVPIRVEGRWLVVHPIGDGRTVEGLAPNPKIVDPAVVMVGSSSAAPEVHPDDALNGVVLVGSAVEELAIQVHLHDAGGGVLDEGPVVPLPFVIDCGRLGVDAVVSAVPSAVPIDAAIAPRQVHIDHALVVGVEAFEEGAVLRLAVGVAVDPALDGDLVGQPTEVCHVHRNAVRGGEVHLSPLVHRRPSLAIPIDHEDRAVLKAIGGHLDIVEGELEDEVALPVPLDGGLKAQREAVRELPGGQPILVGGIGQVKESGQGRVPRQSPLEVHPAGIGGPCHHGNEQAVDGSGAEGRQFLRRPQVLDPPGGRRLKQAIDIAHGTRLDHGLRIDPIDDVLRRRQPDRILHPVDIGDQVGRLKRRVGEEPERVLQGGAVEQACVIEEVGVAQVVPLATRVAQIARGAVLEALEGVLHDHLAVLDAIVGGGEFKPPATGAVIGRRRVVLGFKGVGLDRGRIGPRGERTQENQRRRGQAGEASVDHGRKVHLPPFFPCPYREGQRRPGYASRPAAMMATARRIASVSST